MPHGKNISVVLNDDKIQSSTRITLFKKKKKIIRNNGRGREGETEWYDLSLGESQLYHSLSQVLPKADSTVFSRINSLKTTPYFKSAPLKVWQKHLSWPI